MGSLRDLISSGDKRLSTDFISAANTDLELDLDLKGQDTDQTVLNS